MDNTLAALHAAVINNPAERTVRLIFADALDETGDARFATRAEFIRAQIALETDPHNITLTTRCSNLFTKHWIDWWGPVCEAVGLPAPAAHSRQPRSRLMRTGRRTNRPPGAPYTVYPQTYAVQSEENGFTAHFIGGFPELLYFTRSLPRTLDQWAAAVPLARLGWIGSSVAGEEWQALNSPHLSRLQELILNQLPVGAAATLASSEHLHNLTALQILPLRPAEIVVRELFTKPTWTGLRSLTLNGVTSPNTLFVLAERCALEHLEELSFAIGEVPETPHTFGLTGAIGSMLAEMLVRLFSGHPLPPGPIRWPDYWPALTALARSPWFSRLRRLRISEGDGRLSAVGTLSRVIRLELNPDPETILSDECVLALANALNTDKLEKLELPEARLSTTCRAALTDRFGPRFGPA